MMFVVAAGLGHSSVLGSLARLWNADLCVSHPSNYAMCGTSDSKVSFQQIASMGNVTL